MKKKVFWLAAMAVTVSMASCSLEEVVEQPTPQAIGFSSFVGKPTKAVTQTEKTNLGSFQVYGGYETNTSVFEGVSVTSDNNGNTWNYMNTQYWVPGQSYKFAAMGPSGNDINTKLSFDYTTGHLKLTDYEVTDLATGSKDFVYATAARDNSVSEDYSAVSFTFGHIMSWIKIKFVHKMTPGYKITVSDVTVAGVKTGATFNGTGTSTGTWSTPLSSEATFSNQTPVNNGLTTADAFCQVDFIAIPQTINANDFVISFKLKVQDNATGSYLVGSDAGGVDFSTTLTAEQKWNVNNIYVYTADLTSNVLDLQPINFSVQEVSGWGDTNTSTTPNPIQVP